MNLKKHDVEGAVVEVNTRSCKKELVFDFRSEESELSPLFAGAAWGAMIWDASFELAMMLEGEKWGNVEGKFVVELGACCGLPGLVSALQGARKVMLTDGPEYSSVMKSSLILNSGALKGKHISAEVLWWSRKAAQQFVMTHGRPDVILAAECVSTDVYGRESWESLLEVLDELCAAETGRVLICSKRRKDDGLEEFLLRIKSKFEEIHRSNLKHEGAEFHEFVKRRGSSR